MSDVNLISSELISKEISGMLEPKADQVGIQQWGVKENLEHEDFHGDAFIFHLLVPDMFVVDGTLELRTLKGETAQRIYFKLIIDSCPRYTEFCASDIIPHYLGKLSNDQHVIEMIAPYREGDLGDIKLVRKAISSGNTKLSFSIV